MRKAKSVNINILEQQANRLILPNACHIKIPSEEACDTAFTQIKTQLIKWGICIVDLNYFDAHSITMQKIVDAIGVPHEHDGNGRVLWDIKPNFETNAKHKARSHKMSEFVLHTDCSYEKNCPNFFALHVIQHDRMNGGRNLIVDAGTLVQHLSIETIRVLQKHRVRIRVPMEFSKGQRHDYCYIIDEDLNVCYRKEILDEEALTQKQKKALREFESVAYNPNIARSVSLKKNQILFMDNQRYLHARTKINDKKRHLRRIRFYMTDA